MPVMMKKRWEMGNVGVSVKEEKTPVDSVSRVASIETNDERESTRRKRVGKRSWDSRSLTLLTQ